MLVQRTSHYIDRPAPITTLESPRHNVLKPSTRDIVTIAFEMPLYTAPGEGLMIWILVWPEVSAMPWRTSRAGGSRIPSAGPRGTSPSAPVRRLAAVCTRAAKSEPYGDARERASEHVRGEGEVRRECFIAVHRSATGAVAGAARRSCTRVLLRGEGLVGHGWP